MTSPDIRTTVVGSQPGSDHRKDAFTMLRADGGVKKGITYGRTGEFGYNIIEGPVRVHDLNATMLYLPGLDHERLAYRYQGRVFPLTDVHGKAPQL